MIAAWLALVSLVGTGGLLIWLMRLVRAHLRETERLRRYCGELNHLAEAALSLAEMSAEASATAEFWITWQWDPGWSEKVRV